MPMGLEDGTSDSAGVSEEGTIRLSGIICALKKNSVILF